MVFEFQGCFDSCFDAVAAAAGLKLDGRELFKTSTVNCLIESGSNSMQSPLRVKDLQVSQQCSGT